MKLKTFATHPHIILFDGVCNLCNGSVNFIIKHDPQAKFKFAALQSSFAKSLLNTDEQEALGSVIYFQEGMRYERSTAALMILKELDHPLRFLHHLKALPAFLRDPVYNVIAKFRYCWFGKMDACMVPSAEVASRFLAG